MNGVMTITFKGTLQDVNALTAALEELTDATIMRIDYDGEMRLTITISPKTELSIMPDEDETETDYQE